VKPWLVLALLATALILVALSPSARAHEGEVPPVAPDRPMALFEPPAPGSYDLPVIRRVREHELLRSDGSTGPLLDLEPGQVAVVSFIYRNCADARGCPAVLSTLRRLDREIAAVPELAARVRLATASFDPGRDKPEKMQQLRELLEPRGDWRFFTAAADAQVVPVLEDFDQDVLVLATEGGEAPIFAHLVKLFLVDHEGAVRNVYNSSLLDWRLVLNDIKTLTGVR